MGELWTVISNQMIQYQLSYTRFDQILFLIKNRMWDGFY